MEGAGKLIEDEELREAMREKNERVEVGDLIGPDRVRRLEKFELHEDKLILDYLLVREEKGTLSGLPVVTFSYSVVNKQDRNIHIDAQLVGLAADGAPVLAISASPPSSLVASQASRSVANSVYISAGQLTRAAKLCVSFGGDF